MKKKAILFLLFLFIPTMVFANSIEIENLNTNLKVIENGDFLIEENFTFTGDQNNNGLYRTIAYENSKGIEDLKVVSDDNEFKKVESAKNGDAYVYTLEDNGSEIKIKAYIPWQNKTNLKVIYTLKDAAIKGVDTGEISFNFLSALDTPLQSFTGVVSADNVDFNDKIFFVDGNNSSISVFDSSLQVKSYDLSDGDYISLNAEIPLEAIKYSTNNQDIYLDDISENQFNNDFQSNPLNKITLPIIFITVIGSIFCLKNLLNKRNSGKTLGHIMKLSPAEASSFIFGNNHAQSFILATLLDFENKGYLTVEKEDYLTEKKKKERENYIFNKTNIVPVFSSKAEEYLYNLFFKDSNSFNSKDLNDDRRHNGNNFNKDFYEYIKILNNDLVLKGLKNKNNNNILSGIVFLLLSVLFIIFAIIGGFLGKNILGIIVFILSIILLINSIRILGMQSSLGYEQYKYYNNLYNTLLKEDDFSEYSKEDRENLIIYSIAFGIKYDRLSILKDNFNINANSFIPLYWYGSNISNMQKEMNHSLVGNENGMSSFNSSSSTMGGSGATGGGSAGGF